MYGKREQIRERFDECLVRRRSTFKRIVRPCRVITRRVEIDCARGLHHRDKGGRIVDLIHSFAKNPLFVSFCLFVFYLKIKPRCYCKLNAGQNKKSGASGAAEFAQMRQHRRPPVAL